MATTVIKKNTKNYTINWKNGLNYNDIYLNMARSIFVKK